MIKKIILILLILLVKINAQQLSQSQLDSLYNLYTSLRGINESFQLQTQIEEEPSYRKCGFGIVQEIKNNLSSFSVEQQAILSKILQRPSLPSSIVSPSGFFRIHYSTTGTDAIAYDVNLLAQALDSSYSFEVNYLGYPAPPADGSAGGDDKYDVYVRNLGNLYGQTTSESSVGISSWTSYLEMDNDFPWYSSAVPPKLPIDAAKVTAAHEFHHAIQMGNYAPQGSSSSIRDYDTFFYEITSTSMEEFVFSSVNDYYDYMNDYFRNPERPFKLSDGYSLAIWNIYLKDVFGFDIIKKQWELIPTYTALDAINKSIVEEGSTFGYVLNTFGVWTYYTNSRAISGKYFSEASNYPLIDPTTTVNFSAPSQQYDMSIGTVANYFLKVNLPSNDGTFYSIISNSNVSNAYDSPLPDYDFSFSIYNNINSGDKVLNDKYSTTFNHEDQRYWNNVGILNDIIVYSDSSFIIPDLAKEIYSFPSPFRYSKDFGKGISIAFESNSIGSNDLDFNVYTSSLKLVYSGKAIVERSYIKNSKQYFEFSWDGLDNDKKHLASGVYLFFIKIDSDIKKGKLVIFND
ncbi:MAG: MXAN_6640 family putative metalloprotease [Ignavibacteriaceae bacterium]